MTHQETTPQCPRCKCFLSGPKDQNGCGHCGHLNARDEDDRHNAALGQIHKLAGDFWGIQEEGDARAALERIGQIVLRTLARPDGLKGTYVGCQLAYEPHPSEIS